MTNRLEALPVDLITIVFSHVSLQDAERLHEDDNFRQLSPNLVTEKCRQAYRAIRVAPLPEETTTKECLVFKDPFAVLLDLKRRPQAHKHVLSLDISYLNNYTWWQACTDRVISGENQASSAGIQDNSTVNKAGSADNREDGQAIRCWAYQRLFTPEWLAKYSWVARINAGLRPEYLCPHTRFWAVNAPPFHEDPFDFSQSSHLADLFHLLAALPNLESLAISVPAVELRALGKIWHELEEHSLARLPGYKSRPYLGQLKILKISPVMTELDEFKLPRDDLLLYCSKMPGLRRVILDGRGYRFNTVRTQHAPKNLAWQVQRLEIINLNIDVFCFLDILLFFSRLQQLVVERYEDHRSEPGDRAQGSGFSEHLTDMDPTAMIPNADALLDGLYAQSQSHQGSDPKWVNVWTLFKPLVSPRVLAPCCTITTLRVGFEPRLRDILSPETTPLHLLGFPNLHTLDVAATLFCTISAKTPLGEGLAELRITTQPLHECLPAKLELLKLQKIPTLAVAKDLFEGMPGAKDAKLPKLKRLVISSPAPAAVKYVCELAKDLGIRVEVVDVNKEWVPFATSLP